MLVEVITHPLPFLMQRQSPCVIPSVFGHIIANNIIQTFTTSKKRVIISKITDISFLNEEKYIIYKNINTTGLKLNLGEYHLVFEYQFQPFTVESILTG